MSKKNLRTIIVDGAEYKWRIDSYNCDGDGGYRFKIWKDKKIFYLGLIHNTIITPKNVSEKIFEINEI